MFTFQMVQEIGNAKGRAVYEANLPENFRRPQTDSYPFGFFEVQHSYGKIPMSDVLCKVC
jgi:stromal membrane-associated protein